MGVSVACLWRLLLLALLVTPSAGHIRSWGPRGHVSAHSQRGSHAGKAYSVAQNETTAFSHALGDGVTAGMVTYFWLTSGPTDFLGRYVTDNLIVRYYIDDEPEASLVFTPAMMAGSGVGLEHLSYYRVNSSDPARSNCSATAPDYRLCGQDLDDGWPWSQRWVGKGGATSSWISHVRVPFSLSFRVTLQIACGTPECADFGIPPELARPDINATTSVGSDFAFRGLEASSADELSVSLGMGSLQLPPPSSDSSKGKWSNFRLRLQRQVSHPEPGEFVALANYTGDSHEDGAVLMLTVAFEGINAKNGLSIEGCWWALDSPAASLHPGENSSDRRGAQLLGTGVEDLFGDGFGFSWFTKLFRSDSAGLTHVRGGVNAEPVTAGNERGLFSAFRFFDKDPLTFEGGRLGLFWRNGGPKCGLESDDDHEAHAEAEALPESDGGNESGEAPQVGSLTSYVWFYTWE